MKTESVPRTLLIAVAVALACSAVVATAVNVLRPIQQAYQQLDRNRSVLRAAGLEAAALDDRAVVAAFLALDARIVDLHSGTFADGAAVPDPRSYDHWATAEQAAGDAGAAAEPLRYVPAYLAWQDDRLRRLVLPVHGRGMWSTIYAYIALEGDFTEVAALTVHRHGETPGIGDRIEDPQWLARWRGKRIYDASGDVRLSVVRQPQDARFDVDMISGASVTSAAVGDLVRDWLGPERYGPFLERLRRDPHALSPP